MPKQKKKRPVRLMNKARWSKPYFNKKNMKAGKIWGKTEMVHKNGVLEFHRIEFNKGFKVL